MMAIVQKSGTRLDVEEIEGTDAVSIIVETATEGKVEVVLDTLSLHLLIGGTHKRLGGIPLIVYTVIVSAVTAIPILFLCGVP